MESEESSMESDDFGFMIGWISFVFGSAILVCLYCTCLYYTQKQGQENLEMIERQDQVIKTYQIAKISLGNGLRKFAAHSITGEASLRVYL